MRGWDHSIGFRGVAIARSRWESQSSITIGPNSVTISLLVSGTAFKSGWTMHGACQPARAAVRKMSPTPSLNKFDPKQSTPSSAQCSSYWFHPLCRTKLIPADAPPPHRPCVVSRHRTCPAPSRGELRRPVFLGFPSRVVYQSRLYLHPAVSDRGDAVG
jgi:hypothetical protein